MYLSNELNNIEFTGQEEVNEHEITARTVMVTGLQKSVEVSKIDELVESKFKEADIKVVAVHTCGNYNIRRIDK